MGAKRFPGPNPSAYCIDEGIRDIQGQDGVATRPRSKSEFLAARPFPNDIQCRRRRPVRGMDRESSTVLGSVELGKATRIPATFFRLCVKVCHPSFGIFCRNDALNRPLNVFESEIGYLPYTACAVRYVNLRIGLLLRHGGYRQTWQRSEIMRSNLPL
jgi:hypothetical protein